MSSTCVLLGLVSFGKSLAYLEIIGDILTTTSAFALIGAGLGAAAVFGRRSTALLLPALAAQIPAFTLLWQHVLPPSLPWSDD